MTKFFTLAFILCAIYVSVESKPTILNTVNDALSGVTCTITGLIGKCSTAASSSQPAQPVNTVDVQGETATDEPETGTRRIIQTASCQAGYRKDRTGICRKIA